MPLKVFSGVNNRSTPQEKIALFRSLFRGREDIYPRRFENKKTGKSGYSPVCGNEWVRGICEKPKIKCSECQYRRFLTVTDEVIHWHLSGHDNIGKDFVMGIYPMLLDETCLFLAADFDKASWEEDALAFKKTCDQMGLPAAIERSRSGKGAHAWLFFSEAIAAGLARKLGCHILTETMERRPGVGLDSYDRFFPNQDTLPKGGFGNLIALPLQKKARARSNSIFVDDQLVAYEDQWAFLSNLSKISRQTVEDVVGKAEAKGRVLGVKLHLSEDEDPAPWNRRPSRQRHVLTVGNVPESLDLVVGNQIYIAKEGLSSALQNKLIRLAAFQNPEFYRAQAMRHPTYAIPRIIACAEELPNYLALPRGCLEEVHELLSDLKVKTHLREELFSGLPLQTNFLGELRPEQKVAVEALLAHDTGVLSATTAFGKTVIAAWLIAKRQVNTLVLVHRSQLQEQWIARLSMFLDIPHNEIGRIGGGRRKPKGQLDVALIQSMIRKDVVDDVIGQYGYVIVDECHHLSAQSFERVTRESKAKYITGLTATLKRKDGHHPIITMQCGPVRHIVNAKVQAAKRPFEHTVLVRPTPFFSAKEADADVRLQFNDLYNELINDATRNQLICDDVVKAIQNKRSPIVLTERKDHLEILSRQLSPHVRHLIVLRGGMNTKAMKEATSRLAAIPEDEERVLLATGRFVGEGFDDSRLDTLFLTLPISWQGTIAQYVGRLHRLHDNKREVQVYDYADLNVPMLERMFDKRCIGYESVGYTIMLPASAIPGWPSQALLPVDPPWKNDYGASVRRLIRDGVDTPLAHLFVQASSVPLIGAIGADRARSAIEAFFYRRLETLPETTGKFQLNGLLTIPFDNSGHMEIDFLFVDARIAVEIDGVQHLGDAEAYRSDRRKDALLQQHGYLVLRFLAEDVSKRLDDVLDSILCSLARRVQPPPN
jgi:superfamily II DNA or RNA helicase/very-short-patch-repair endonuclease